jgi:hypothetical protein
LYGLVLRAKFSDRFLHGYESFQKGNCREVAITEDTIRHKWTG